MIKTDRVRNRALMLALILAIGGCNEGETGSKGTRSVSFTATEQATAEDVGLPTYPGSKPYKDEDQTGSTAQVGFSTPLFGLKVVAVRLETADEPKQVAAFYKEALAKHGHVLDCSDPEGSDSETKSAAAHGDDLACDSNDSRVNKFVYKVGVKKNLRVVEIKPHGSGSRFSLVHVHVRD